MDAELLKYYIRSANMTYRDIRDHLNISHTAFQNRISGKVEFKRNEIESLINLLKLDREKAMRVFFTNEVS